MRVEVTTRAGSWDVTKLLPTYTWSGEVKTLARRLDFSMAVSETAGRLPRVEVPVGSVARLLTDEGTPLFSGYVVQRKKNTEGTVLTHRCLDRGLYLAQNSGWYTVKGETPEGAVRRVCGDFGIPVASLAATGVKVSRKLPGVALSKIVSTLYGLAAERTGKKYLARFTGAGALEVVEKSETPNGPVVAARCNLMGASVTESMEKMCNSVAIYNEYGKVLRVVEDADAVSLYGLMRQALTQKKEDVGEKAAALLEDGGLSQTIEVESLGDTRLVSGTTVTMRDNSAGLTGVFWIDSDTHTWKNGLHVCRLGLNLRNVMDDQMAGSEVK